ncbi:MAG: Gfo/Idh/MocA family oxidoreductase [Thermoanaerobaculia bacterium]|nr:Gfo/Idh/MocA family oxidoreductase [Thermoanaerobaculia bacterium]
MPTDPKNPTSPSLPLAVVGAGAVAVEHHLPALGASPRTHAEALVDLDLERARTVGEKFGIPRTAERVEEVIDSVDGAIVALPNHLHAPVAIDLMERGLHVLVEKPMARTVSECEAMIGASRETGVVLAVGLEFRFLPGFRAVADLLRSGALGTLESVDLQQGVDLFWPLASDYLFRKDQAGGGVLMDFGSHVLDLLLWWLGDLELLSYEDDARGGVEANCEIELRAASGAPVRVELGRNRNLRNTCRFRGNRALLEVDVWSWSPTIQLTFGGAGTWVEGRGEAGSGQPAELREAFVAEIEEFLTAIAEDRPARISGEEGARHIRLIEKCYASRRRLVFPWLEGSPVETDR